MTLAADRFAGYDRSGRVRWGGSLLMVLVLLHAAIGVYLASRHVGIEAPERQPPAVMIDLVPLPPVAPAPSPSSAQLQPQPAPLPPAPVPETVEPPILPDRPKLERPRVPAKPVVTLPAKPPPPKPHPVQPARAETAAAAAA